MPLDSLLKLVETLKQRIVEHKAALSQSEALTRYALIDPFLRELGWSTEDPNLVIPEYRSGKGSADYALMVYGKPAVIVEAKRLDTLLRDVLAQGIQYCLMEGTKHFAVTDGRRWEVFETHKAVPIEEKLVVSFDLVEDSPSEICRKAFVLWRPSAEEGRLLAGQMPIVPTLTPIETGDSRADQKPSRPEVQAQVDWRPLDQLQVKKGASPPVEMELPDGSLSKLPYWNRVLRETVNWLIEKNKLNDSNLPFIPTGSSWNLIAKTPYHPNGNRMSNAHEVYGGWHVETSHSGPDCVWYAVLTIQHAGQDPSAFKVRFS